MLGSHVRIKLLCEWAGYEAGTEMTAAGGAAWASTEGEVVGETHAMFLCIDDDGKFVWVPVGLTKAVRRPTVHAAQAGAPLPN